VGKKVLILSSSQKEAAIPASFRITFRASVCLEVKIQGNQAEQTTIFKAHRDL